ncbi:Carboxypeptidase-like regulatory domain-containing protein [Chryseobacterium sp. IT-36CA2]
MKRELLFLFFLLSFLGYSQSKIKVVDDASQKPVFNAKVSCDNAIIGYTNEQGILEFKTGCKNIDIDADSYQKENITVESSMEVSLLKKTSATTNIEAVVIEDKSDPRALEILRKVNKLFNENSPKSLGSYSYKSYEKISLDIDEDSLSQFNQYFNDLNIFKKKREKDSLNNITARKIFSKSKLFLWERAQEFLYSKKYGEKINILDNRISGLKQPIYEMIALQQSNRDVVPEQLKPENRGLYRFFLSDTVTLDGRKNFVIRFREVNYKKLDRKRKYNGAIYVDTETYGVKKIENFSKNKNEGIITSTWVFYNNKWFLAHEKTKLKMGKMAMDDKVHSDDKKDKKSFGTYAFLTSKYFDFEAPIEENPKDFKGYTFSVKNIDGHSLDQYRTEPLTDREKNTYKTIDSLGKKYKIDTKAQILSGLLNGQIRVGSVDFAVDEVVNYNSYEGFRLGLKAKLNENFNPYFSPDYYFAYGVKDRKWKYGMGLDMKTTLEKNSIFRFEVYDDVTASGEFNRKFWNFKMRTMNFGNNLNNDKYFHFKGMSLSYLNDVTNGLTLALAVRRNTEQAEFDYQFRDRGTSYRNFNTLFTLKYSPNSTNIMTPQGKSLIDQRYPELYFNYEQSYKMLQGDFSYSRFDALFVHNFKTPIGTTGFRLYGGAVLGGAPIWKNFTMNGLASPGKDFNFNLTSYLGFATLEGGKYYNDRFIAYYFTHKLPWYLKSFGHNISSFDFVLRGTIGDMKHPEYHQFKFRKLDHLYQEVGLEWNNFLSSYFNLGLFYRVGYYATPHFRENFAIQFKLKFLEF